MSAMTTNHPVRGKDFKTTANLMPLVVSSPRNLQPDGFGMSLLHELFDKITGKDKTIPVRTDELHRTTVVPVPPIPYPPNA